MVVKFSAPWARPCCALLMLTIIGLKCTNAAGATLDSCLAPADITASGVPLALTLQQQKMLSSSSLCVGQQSVPNGNQRWTLLIVQSRSDPYRLMWFTPHTNEPVAFETAIDAVSRYGGTLVAVRTENKARCLNGEDPNRLFGAIVGSGTTCDPSDPHPVKVLPTMPVPPYTRAVLYWRVTGHPIIALHNNQSGYGKNICKGKPATGYGNITVACNHRNITALPAKASLGSSPTDTMVYLTRTVEWPQLPAVDPTALKLVQALNANRIIVAYEFVTLGQSDLSLSNYAVLNGIMDYFNSEVVDGDLDGQKEVIRLLVHVLEVRGILPPPAGAVPGHSRQGP